MDSARTPESFAGVSYGDANAGGAHINFNGDVNLWPWALVTLGGEFQSPTL